MNPNPKRSEIEEMIDVILHHSGWIKIDDWICEACYQRFIESGYGKKLGEMRSDVA